MNGPQQGHRPFRATGQLFAAPTDDAARREFMERLDNARAPLTDWEVNFLESILDWEGDFTPRQRESVDRLMEKYRNQT